MTVPRAVDEESRDVRAGVLRYLIKLVNYSCSVFCKVNYQYTFEYFKIYNVSLVFFYLCDGFYNRGINHLSFQEVHYVLIQ